MQLIKNKKFDAERALYGVDSVHLIDCIFDGEADGESALKESKNIKAEKCVFNLRYPLWHDTAVELFDCETTESCRAALWYSEGISVKNSTLHGIKALRECSDVTVEDSDIASAEFGWFCKNVQVRNTEAKGEYFMLRTENLNFDNVKFVGKYSFQYIKNATFENCVFDTKDAFWHAENVVVKNCVVNGEYLAWYSKNIVFENCIISGTQPLCYCKELKLVNCEMHNADLAFELSDVEAKLNSPIISIKNPLKGNISVPSVGEIIRDNVNCTCKIIVDKI